MKHTLKMTLFAASLIVAMSAVAAPNVSAAPPSRTAFATLKEQFKDKIVKIREGQFSFPIEVRTGAYSVTGAIPLAGVDIAQFGAATQLLFNGALDHLEPLGNGQDGLLVNLGQDPRYRAGAKKATIVRTTTNGAGRAVKVVTVALKWTSTAMNFKITGIINSQLQEEGVFAEAIVDVLGVPPGQISEPARLSANLLVNNGAPMGLGLIGQLSFQFALTVSGKHTQKTQIVGRGKSAQEFDLQSVQISGTATDVQNQNE